MQRMRIGIAKLVTVCDDRGHRWQAFDMNIQIRPSLAVGTAVAIEATAAGDAMYGFAVGDEIVAVSEWNDTGRFEFHVLERYAAKGVVLHVAVRRHGAQGKTPSDWLGEVDDLWVIKYRVDC